MWDSLHNAPKAWDHPEIMRVRAGTWLHSSPPLTPPPRTHTDFAFYSCPSYLRGWWLPGAVTRHEGEYVTAGRVGHSNMSASGQMQYGWANRKMCQKAWNWKRSKVSAGAVHQKLSVTSNRVFTQSCYFSVSSQADQENNWCCFVTHWQLLKKPTVEKNAHFLQPQSGLNYINQQMDQAPRALS